MFSATNFVELMKSDTGLVADLAACVCNPALERAEAEKVSLVRRMSKAAQSPLAALPEDADVTSEQCRLMLIAVLKEIVSYLESKKL